MFTFSIFILSGAGIVTLAMAKRLEEKPRRKTAVFLLKVISHGDEKIRALHHEAFHHYSHSKEKFAFWFKKQLPLKLKSVWNRVLVYMRSKSVEYLGDVRNSRLLKKSDGISEFFKNISEIEKGGGEINETLESHLTEDIPEPISEPLPKTLHSPRKKKVHLAVIEEL